MLQIQLIRENPQFVIDRLKVKNFDAKAIIDAIAQLDVEIRQNKKVLDDNLMEQKKLSADIGKLFKEGKTAEAQELKKRIAELKEVNNTRRWWPKSPTKSKISWSCCQICPILPCLLAKPLPIMK